MLGVGGLSADPRVYRKENVMKKFLLSILCILMVFGFTACAQQTTGEEAWNKFHSALEITASLEYYSLKTVRSDGSLIKEGRLVLSSDSNNKTVAYREDGATRSWWIDGVAYVEDGADKIKIARSINSFLDISESSVSWSYDMVKDVKLKSDEVTFNVTYAGFDNIAVSAVIDGLFLSEITVSTTYASTGESASLKYIYENVGQKPVINLPDDLSIFVWEV